MIVPEEILDLYQRDGAVLLKSVFTPDWVDKVRQGIEKNFLAPSIFAERLKSKEGEGVYFNDYFNWRRIEEFKEFAFNSPAASIAGQLMQSRRVVFYHEHVLNKEPGTSQPTPWHHDQSYYPIDGFQICSLWMPVDHVPKESCVQFVAGSHLWPQWFHPRFFATQQNYSLKVQEEELQTTDSPQAGREYTDVPVEEIEEGKWPILSWECQPGDVIAFHGKTVHGAKGNFSDTCHRRVLSTRWLGDDAVLADRPWKVSPPETGGLQIGDKAECDTFPLVYIFNDDKDKI